ncbi:hypothetical protein CC86DRAFT_400109 [Ophiobolus disseminans]|uniref:Uncharacterized protein n=1 Tax=Ophiobolus disseminans TaxID=1469910 RepID=A0A6A7AJL8_9PLEO|nr:hypothetical protein CC86DRAFT_400109 [Ophiobolus disseminans]
MATPAPDMPAHLEDGDRILFLAHTATFILQAPRSELGILFNSNPNIPLILKTRPTAFMEQTIEYVVLRFCLDEKSPDVLLIALLLLLRMRLSCKPHLDAWKDDGLSDREWIAAAVMVAWKFEEDIEYVCVLDWAERVGVDSIRALAKAETQLLTYVDWRLWIQDHVLEQWKVGLRGLWEKMGEAGVLEMPALEEPEIKESSSADEETTLALAVVEATTLERPEVRHDTPVWIEHSVSGA